MIRPKCIIVHRHEEHDEEEHKHHHSNGLPYEEAANALMNAKGYIEYVMQHGYHFTDALAEKVCSMMRNADGTPHRWTVPEVKAVVGTLPGDATWGDVTYLANMAYADFYPKVLQTENACIQYALAVVKDVDGYEGLPFCRWTADAIGKRVSIDWEAV